MRPPKKRAYPRLSVVSNELHKKISLPEMPSLSPIWKTPSLVQCKEVVNHHLESVEPEKSTA